MKFIEIFAIWVMINRAVLIICCEDVLWGYDILLWNFGNSESRLHDDTALVYVTVKDFNITLREDLQRIYSDGDHFFRHLGCDALNYWYVLMHFSVRTQSPDGIAVSVQGFVVGLFLRSPFFQIASLFS